MENKNTCKRKELEWKLAKVTQDFQVATRKFCMGDKFRLVARNITSHSRTQTITFVLSIIRSDMGDYYAIADSPVALFDGYMKIIELLVHNNCVPISGITRIINFSQYFTLIDGEDDDPWDNIKVGDRLICEPSYENSCFVKVYGFTIGKSYEIKNVFDLEFYGGTRRCRMLELMDDYGRITQIPMFESLKEIFRIEPKEINKVDDIITGDYVTFKDSLLYLLTECEYYTPLNQILEHLPTNGLSLHDMDNLLFRAMCGTGNVDGIKWFMYNLNCELDPDGIRYSTSLERVAKQLNLSYGDFKVTSEDSIRHMIAKYNKGCIDSPVRMILLSRNVVAIYELLITNKYTLDRIEYDLAVDIVINCMVNYDNPKMTPDIMSTVFRYLGIHAGIICDAFYKQDKFDHILDSKMVNDWIFRLGSSEKEIQMIILFNRTTGEDVNVKL